MINVMLCPVHVSLFYCMDGMVTLVVTLFPHASSIGGSESSSHSVCLSMSPRVSPTVQSHALIRLIGVSLLSIMNSMCERVFACVCMCVNLVMDWYPIQGVPQPCGNHWFLGLSDPFYCVALD